MPQHRCTVFFVEDVCPCTHKHVQRYGDRWIQQMQNWEDLQYYLCFPAHAHVQAHTRFVCMCGNVIWEEFGVLHSCSNCSKSTSMCSTHTLLHMDVGNGVHMPKHKYTKDLSARWGNSMQECDGVTSWSLG